MKGIVLGLGLMVMIAAIAGVGLGTVDRSASTTYTSPNDSVRLN
jgi:hypothetical protein